MSDKLRPYFLYTPDDPPAGDPPKKDEPLAGDPPKKPDGGGEGKKEYTQEELDTMFAERAKRAGSKALTDLYAGLGLKDAKALKALVSDANKKADDEKSDLEKAQTNATDWEAKHSALAKSQRLDRVRYAVENAAREQKVIEGAVSDVFALIDQSKIEFDEDGLPQEVDKAVKAVLKTRAHMIASTNGRTDNDASHGSGSALTGGYTLEKIAEIASFSGVSAERIKEGLGVK